MRCMWDVLYDVGLVPLVAAGVIENYTSSKEHKKQKYDLFLKYWWDCTFIFYEIQEEVYFLSFFVFVLFFPVEPFVLSLIEDRVKVMSEWKRTAQHRTSVTTCLSFGCPAQSFIGLCPTVPLTQKWPSFQFCQENSIKKHAEWENI